MFKIEDEKTVPELFAEEAKFFTEVRLLQRDVKIVLEGASNQNLLGTIIHPVSNAMSTNAAICVSAFLHIIAKSSRTLCGTSETMTTGQY